ncbi:MAG: hypothetical protein JO372_08675 [Solirubrobacterales bacterium]|nr:hypothetical protein [Solirubrobacterales bacterium]
MAIAGAATVADLIRFLEPDISRCLGTAPTAAIRMRAQSLPLGPFRLLGLEIPLSVPAAPVDLLLQLAPAVALRAVAASLSAGNELASLLAVLTHRHHEHFGEVGDAWLEYDIGSGDGRRPSLFAGPAKPTLAVAVARILHANPAAEAGLQRLVEALGNDDRVQQIGVMHGRRQPELRCVLTSSGTGAASAMRALARVGWPGDLAALADVLLQYGPLGSRQSVGIGFDSGGELSVAVGVELLVPGRPDAERLLRRMEDDGLAAPGATSRLLAWHGHALDPAGDGAPDAFRALSALTRGKAVPAVIRRIHHIKLTLAPDRTLAAKAYLGAALRLVV